MSNYIIDIIDTENNNVVLSLEKAIRASVVLNWYGGDHKDQLAIIGSSLSFILAGESCEDGQYYDLFTGDESRYTVRLYDENDTTIWTGKLLPDSYSEPYQDAPIEVDFSATDGLGRIKGKYLPEDFYKDEKSVIEIIGKCLELTGLDMHYRFSPAIENSQQKDYNKIYIDTAYFKNGDKKEDAFKILDDLLKSMLCVVYQADDFWNVEGLNIREQRVYSTKIYTYQGDLVDEQEVTRLKKEITPIVTPSVTMQPPFGIVRVDHKRENINFPATISQEENDGWVIIKNSTGNIYATDWFGYNEFYAKARAYRGILEDMPDYNVYFTKHSEPGYITLRNRPYIRKDRKYSLKVSFRIITDPPYRDDVQGFIDNGYWDNPFLFRASLEHKGGNNQTVVDVLYSNYGVPEEGNRYLPLNFDEDKEVKKEVEFAAMKNGILNIFIQPVKDEDNGILRVEITNLEIEELGFKDNFAVTETLNEDYTLKKEVELVYSDDFTGFSKGFRLQKLREKKNYNVIEVPIDRQIQQNGYNYAAVDLKGANLIKENPDVVFNQGNPINVLEVIYNFKNSQEHVIKLDSEITSGGFTVHVYDYNAVKENREYWEEWTDTIFKVERLRYNKVVSNVFNRMFDKPIPALLDLEVKNNIKINDFIGFNYRGKKGYSLTNCNWNIDRGFSNVSAIQSYYAVDAGVNLPPVVEAGNDISISNNEFTVQLTSESFDPDGFIVSYLWEEISGNPATISNPESQNTEVTGLTGDFYIFRITVTDNDGATATDNVTVYRDQEHTLILNETVVNEKLTEYKLVFDPEIADNATINFKGTLNVIADQKNLENEASAAFRIKINGVYSDSSVEYGTDYGGIVARYEANDEFSFPFFKGDEVIFEVEVYTLYNQTGETPYAKSSFTIDGAEFVDGTGTVIGAPITKEKESNP